MIVFIPVLGLFIEVYQGLVNNNFYICRVGHPVRFIFGGLVHGVGSAFLINYIYA